MADPKPIRPKRVPQPKWRVTHHIEFLFPGEEHVLEATEPIKEHTIEAALEQIPERAFAFAFYDLKEADVWVEQDLVRVGKTEPKGGKHFIGGKVYDEAQVVEMRDANPDAYQNLLDNMRANGYKKVIQTRTGNWQAFGPDDVALPQFVR